MVTSPDPRALHNPCGGDLGLDFVNTVEREVEGPSTDTLTDYGDLLLWSRQAGTLPAARVRRLAEEARARPAEAVRVLERARALREAAYRVFDALVGGRRPAPADLDAVNVEVATALAHARIAPAEEGFAWGWDPAPDALDAPLWQPARAIAELLTSPDRERVKQCASATCLWLFVDASKNRKRRWCEMKTCGNRAKVRRHRRARGADG